MMISITMRKILPVTIQALKSQTQGMCHSPFSYLLPQIYVLVDFFVETVNRGCNSEYFLGIRRSTNLKVTMNTLMLPRTRIRMRGTVKMKKIDNGTLEGSTGIKQTQTQRLSIKKTTSTKGVTLNYRRHL